MNTISALNSITPTLQEDGAICLQKTITSLQQKAAIKIATEMWKGQVGQKSIGVIKSTRGFVTYREFVKKLLPYVIDATNQLDLSETCRRIVIHILKSTITQVHRWSEKTRFGLLGHGASAFIKSLHWTSDGRIDENITFENMFETDIKKKRYSRMWNFSNSNSTVYFYTLNELMQEIQVWEDHNDYTLYLHGRIDELISVKFSINLMFNSDHSFESSCLKILWKYLTPNQREELSTKRLLNSENLIDLNFFIFSKMDRKQQIRAIKENGHFLTLSLFYDPVWRWHFLPFLKHFHLELANTCFFTTIMTILVTDFRCDVEPVKCKEILLAILEFALIYEIQSIEQCFYDSRVLFLIGVLVPLLEIGNKDMSEPAYKYFIKLFNNKGSIRTFLLRHCQCFIPTLGRIDDFHKADEMLKQVSGNFVTPAALKKHIAKKEQFGLLLALFLYDENYKRADEMLDYIIHDEGDIMTYKDNFINRPNCSRIYSRGIEALFCILIDKDNDCKSLEKFFFWIYENKVMIEMKCIKSLFFDEKRLTAILTNLNYCCPKTSRIDAFLNWLRDAYDGEKLEQFKSTVLKHVYNIATPK